MMTLVIPDSLQHCVMDARVRLDYVVVNVKNILYNSLRYSDTRRDTIRDVIPVPTQC